MKSVENHVDMAVRHEPTFLFLLRRSTEFSLFIARHTHLKSN